MFMTKNSENPQFLNNLSFKKYIFIIYYNSLKNQNKIVETFIKERELLFLFVFTTVTAELGLIFCFL